MAESFTMWACPAPGCGRCFRELWLLRQHYRAPPAKRGHGGGHGEELRSCPRCLKPLPAPPARHRCKGAAADDEAALPQGDAGSAAAAVGAVVAAAATAAAADGDDGSGGTGQRTAKRQRRVRFAVQQLEASRGSESDTAAGLAASPSLEKVAPQWPLEKPTPQSALAAALLSSLRAQAPLALAAPLLQPAALRAAHPAAPAAPPSSFALGAAAPTGFGEEQQPQQAPVCQPGGGTKWWQAAVRPEQPEQGGTTVVAATAAAPTAERASPRQQAPQAPSLALARDCLPQAAASAEALLSELLHLLQTVVTAGDAEEYVAILVRQWAAQHASAAAAAGQAPGSDATVGRLLASLARDLTSRCAAMRQLLATPEGGGWVRGEVQRCVQGEMLGRLGALLQAAVAQAQPALAAA